MSFKKGQVVTFPYKGNPLVLVTEYNGLAFSGVVISSDDKIKYIVGEYRTDWITERFELAPELLSVKYEQASIFDRVKDVKGACKELTIDYDSWWSMAQKLTPKIKSFAMLHVVTRAINGGWHANFEDAIQEKWYPTVLNGKLNGGVCQIGRGHTAPFVYKSREAAEHMVKYFTAEFESMMND